MIQNEYHWEAAYIIIYFVRFIWYLWGRLTLGLFITLSRNLINTPSLHAWTSDTIYKHKSKLYIHQFYLWVDNFTLIFLNSKSVFYYLYTNLTILISNRLMSMYIFYNNENDVIWFHSMSIPIPKSELYIV